MKTASQTALQIRNNQLVVGGFFVGGNLVPDKHYYAFHDGDFTDPSQPLDVDAASMYQREVTQMYPAQRQQYRLESDEACYIPYNSLLPRRPIPNQDQIDPGLRASTFRALHPEQWYPHSRGTVGRKPAFEGQEPVKNVHVLGKGKLLESLPTGFGGFRRGEWPTLSARTHEGQSQVLLNPLTSDVNGLGKHRSRLFGNPARFNDYIGLLNEPVNGAGKDIMLRMYSDMRKHALDLAIKTVVPKGPLH